MRHEFSWITQEYSAQVIVWVEEKKGDEEYNVEVEFLDVYDEEGEQPEFFADVIEEYVLDWYNSNSWDIKNRFYVKDYIVGEQQ